MSKSNMPEGQMPEEGTQQELDPRLKKDIEGYQALIARTIYGKQTGKNIQKMLQTGDAKMAVSTTAINVIDNVADAWEKKQGKKVEFPVQFQGGLFAIEELITMGNTAGWFQVDEQQAVDILQDTMKQYIAKGIKDKSIDSVELQTITEPLMPEEDRATGLQAAEMTGVPPEANQMTAMEQYAGQREQQTRMQMENQINSQAQNKQRQGQFAQAAQGPQQGGQ